MNAEVPAAYRAALGIAAISREVAGIDARVRRGRLSPARRRHSSSDLKPEGVFMERNAGDARELRRGCLFCRSGRETEVIQRLELLLPDVRWISPAKTRYRRTGGEAREERVTLLPGYIFFQTAEELPVRLIRRPDNVYKVLTYGDGEWRLHGADDLFARMLFETDGVIGMSKAYYDEGDRIRITDGFMKEYEGSIIRVNRRAKTAEIRIPFQDKLLSLWLGFELIEKVKPDNAQ